MWSRLKLVPLSLTIKVRIMSWVVRYCCLVFYVYSLRWGVNSEGYRPNFKLAMIKTCSTWPLLNKYAIKKWRGSSDPTVTSDPLHSLWKRQKLKIWILFLQWSKCIPINLKEKSKHVYWKIRRVLRTPQQPNVKKLPFWPKTAIWD